MLARHARCIQQMAPQKTQYAGASVQSCHLLDCVDSTQVLYNVVGISSVMARGSRETRRWRGRERDVRGHISFEYLPGMVELCYKMKDNAFVVIKFLV